MQNSECLSDRLLITSSLLKGIPSEPIENTITWYDVIDGLDVDDSSVNTIGSMKNASIGQRMCRIHLGNCVINAMVFHEKVATSDFVCLFCVC